PVSRFGSRERREVFPGARLKVFAGFKAIDEMSLHGQYAIALVPFVGRGLPHFLVFDQNVANRIDLKRSIFPIEPGISHRGAGRLGIQESMAINESVYFRFMGHRDQCAILALDYWIAPPGLRVNGLNLA